MIYFHETKNLETRSGYGGAFQALASALVKGHSDRVFVYPPYAFKPQPKIDLEIFCGFPTQHYANHFDTDYGCPRGIYTMWEVDRIRPDLIRCIEKYFDFVVVPTTYCQKIFQQHLPDHPVYLSPNGLWTETFPYLQRDFRKQPFTVIWQGFSMEDRKRRDLAETAFKELNLPDARLVMKAMSRVAISKVPMYGRGLRESFISDNWTVAEQLSMWQQCDLGVMPSEGEGIGMIPLEQMCTGMPVALADNSGAHDYCDERYNLPMKCEIEKEYIHGWGVPVRVPSIEEIQSKILWAYQNREESLALGRKAAMWIREQHSSNVAADKFIRTCEQVLQDFKKPEVICAAV